MRHPFNIASRASRSGGLTVNPYSRRHHDPVHSRMFSGKNGQIAHYTELPLFPPGQDDVIAFVANDPRAEPMNQSMMVRTQNTNIFGAVVLDLGDILNVMNLKDGACRGLIIPFIYGALGSLTMLNLASCPHQTDDQLSQTGRAHQPLVCFSSA